MILAAILVAIAIPTFTASLERARDAASIANIRSAYAEAMVAVLTGTEEDGVTISWTTEGSAGTVAVANVNISSAKADDWNDIDEDLPFTLDTDTGVPGAYTFTFTIADGTIDPTTAVTFS